MGISKTRFQALWQFTRKKDRAAAGTFLVEGWRWLEEALALPSSLECVLATPDAARSPVEASLLARARVEARDFCEVSPEQLARLTDSVSAAGVAALVKWRPTETLPLDATLAPTAATLVVALDAVGDPGNAGTIVRTADWFGAAAIVFGAGSVEPTNPKSVRATMGSLFHLPIVEANSLVAELERLRTAGFASVGASLDGEALSDFRWPEHAVLVIGNEANGIQPAVKAVLQHHVCIPAYGRAESLNAAVAAAVLMADWRRSVSQ